MDIICHDHSEGKLIYALDFLAYLNASSYEVNFSLSAQQLVDYRLLFRHLPNLKINENSSVQKDTVHIVFSDAPPVSEEPGQYNLVLPITTEKKKREWNTFTSERVVPLSESGNPRHSVIVADYLSACDMLERRMCGAPLKNKRLIVSAGPTAEDIDPVRFITNRSSGKMGIAVARTAFQMGAEVRLVLGPTSEPVPLCLKTQRVRSAREMAEAVLSVFPQYDAYIAAAAVADFTPEQTAEHKIKKAEAGLTLRLMRTPDILEGLKKRRPEQMVVGFSMETKNLLENSLLKLNKKNLDWIVANNPTEPDAGFAADTNKVILINRQGGKTELPTASKLDIARQLLEIIFE